MRAAGVRGKKIKRTDCEASDIGHWLRNDSFLGSAVQVRRADRGVRPYTGEGVQCAAGRADVGSELRAAGGRGSEVSEWPRSKF